MQSVIIYRETIFNKEMIDTSMNIKKSIKTQVKRICATALSFVMMGQPVVGLAADYTQAGKFDIMSEEKGVYISNSNQRIYYPNNEGGFTVYVPYNHEDSGETIMENMFYGLFDIYKTGVGSNYAPAGAKYITSNSKYTRLNGAETKYFIKTISTRSSGNIEEAATTDLKSFEPEYCVEFRYAGVIVSSDGTGKIVTNPTFLQDSVHENQTSGKSQKGYDRYDKDGTVKDTLQLYAGYTSDDIKVLEVQNLAYSYAGGYGVPAVNAKESPYYAQAPETFEKWAAVTDEGAEYKKKYERMETPWYNSLKDKLHITGDYKTQSVIFTAVNNVGGTWYRTYSIPYPIKNNMIASKVQILDEKMNVLDYSYILIRYDYPHYKFHLLE